MGWVVESHLNCSASKRPAEWTLCTFDVINGSVLAGMGVVGIILNSLVLYIILIAKVTIGGKQRYFLANLIFADLFLAVCAWFRGSGTIGEKLFPGGYRVTPWCIIFTLMLNIASFVNNLALIPITLERYFAVCWPFIHRDIMTTRNCLIICCLVWVPNAVFLAIEIISYSMPGENTLDFKWNANYHRCTYLNFSASIAAKEIICFFIPFFVILFSYGSIIAVLVKNRMSAKRILLITGLVVMTGLLSWTPSIVIRLFSIDMNYKVAHVITMTMWFWCIITDPIIYIFGFPSVQRYLKAMLLCRKYVPERSNSTATSSTGRSTRVVARSESVREKNVDNC